ncbi:MAG TPA: hypothetical protein PK812_04530 [Beijerinckiaceae bacterium]|nr:hypothetical protein [Beijerinckiaceae bacterium]
MSGNENDGLEVLCRMTCHEPPGRPFARWFHGLTGDGWDYMLAESREAFAPRTVKCCRIDPTQGFTPSAARDRPQ